MFQANASPQELETADASPHVPPQDPILFPQHDSSYYFPALRQFLRSPFTKMALGVTLLIGGLLPGILTFNTETTRGTDFRANTNAFSAFIIWLNIYEAPYLYSRHMSLH